VAEAARQLNQWVKVAVVKDGARGAWVAAEDRVWLVPGIHAGDAVDTTGAGDCFNAGFLFGRIVENASYDISARYGNICGGLSVTGVGGATAAPTYAGMRDWMENIAQENLT
jgi:sugar/nucleoside kinase (ribokinase family)